VDAFTAEVIEHGVHPARRDLPYAISLTRALRSASPVVDRYDTELTGGLNGD